MLACGAVAREASEGGWGRQDSNLRSHKTADLQSAPFATRDTPPSQQRQQFVRKSGGGQNHQYGAEPATPGNGARSGAFMGKRTRKVNQGKRPKRRSNHLNRGSN